MKKEFIGKMNRIPERPDNVGNVKHNKTRFEASTLLLSRGIFTVLSGPSR